MAAAVEEERAKPVDRCMDVDVQDKTKDGTLVCVWKEVRGVVC